MSQLKLYLFGPPRVERAGQPIEINLRKALALFVYLGVTRQAYSRDTLATLFWPDRDQQAARANLRRTLYDLNQLLGEPIIDAQPETVSLHSTVELWSDMTLFQNYLAEHMPANPTIPTPAPAALQPLMAAVELYKDDFLAGFNLPDCPMFDDWQFFQREELRRAFATLLQQLVRIQQAGGKFEEAVRYTRRWLLLDPLEETVHRHLMQLYAQAGQQAAALRQYEECVAILQEEIGVKPEAETQALYETIRTRRFTGPQPKNAPVTTATPVEALRPPSLQAELITQAAPTSAAQLPHNLPVHATPFVGRVQELTEILQRLHDPACRLLTLVGPGGIGKTRLALETAKQLVNEVNLSTTEAANAWFADGIFFVSLQPVTTTSGVIAAIAEGVGFRFYSDTPPQQQLVNFLHTKQLLLVLDNLEHLPEGALLVAELLSKAPNVKILATSQKALNLYEEWFHPLTGMTLPHAPVRQLYPDLTQTGELSSAAADAVQLFVQSARRARSDFTLAAENEAVVRICRLVDGMPLAIELAAAWLKVLPCPKIADELERSLDLLTTRHQNIPVRHRSMQAVLEQAWQLLDEEQRDVLKRLAVFRGGCTQDAAQAIADADVLTLVTLVENALLWMTPSGRYQMHELLRQFAEKQLAAHPQEEQAARTQHSTYYLRFLQARTATLVGADQRVALDEINQEIENIRLSWQWAAQQQVSTALDQAVEPLYHFYQIQSRYHEGKELFAQAWTLRQHSDPSALRLGDALPTGGLPVRLLARYGAFCHFLCDYETASQTLQVALTWAQARHETSEVAFVLNFLGQLAVWQGEKATAKQYLEQSLTLSRDLNDQSGMASALDKLANLIHATFGEYVESKALATQSLALSRRLGRPDWVAYALDTLGFVTFCLGEYQEAEAYYRESLALFENSGDQYGMAMALGGLGLVLWGIGGAKLAEASEAFQQSLLICRKIGHQGQITGRLAGLVRVANDQGEYEQAQRWGNEALTIARPLGSPVYLAHILYSLGETAYKTDNFPAARRYLMEAISVTAKANLHAYLLITLFHYAQLLLRESKAKPGLSEQNGEEKQAKAFRLFTLVQNHPACWQVYKARSAQVQAALAAQLPPSILVAAEAYTDSHTLDEIVAEILESTILAV